MITFKATDEQVKQIAVNAVQASKPIGMGFLHYNPSKKYNSSDFTIGHSGIDLDYINGRMVKLYLWKIDDGIWKINGKAQSDYQSWVHKYPTYEDLLKSVEGVELIRLDSNESEDHVK